MKNKKKFNMNMSDSDKMEELIRKEVEEPVIAVGYEDYYEDNHNKSSYHYFDY